MDCQDVGVTGGLNGHEKKQRNIVKKHIKAPKRLLIRTRESCFPVGAFCPLNTKN